MFGNTDYTLDAYGEMIVDRVRMQAYVHALKSAVKDGSVVLDLGAGTGIMSLLACRFGASRVYAVEPADAVFTGMKISDGNGYADRIQFIQDMSLRVDLPETVDVIVSDLRGTTPMLQHHIPSVIDARERFLAPGGVLIPQSDLLFMSVVESDRNYRTVREPWQYNELDFDLSACNRVVSNNMYRWIPASDLRLLTPPVQWGRLDYASIQSPDVEAEASLTITESGMAHGLVVWFDTTLFDGFGFSNHPGETELVYGSSFLPFERPVQLQAGDTVRVVISVKLGAEDYNWTWNTDIYPATSGVAAKASFRQSTFFGYPLSLDKLKKREAAHVPVLNDEGEFQLRALKMMDGSRDLDQIARQAMQQFPDRYTSIQQAFDEFCNLSLKFSRS